MKAAKIFSNSLLGVTALLGSGCSLEIMGDIPLVNQVSTKFAGNASTSLVITDGWPGIHGAAPVSEFSVSLWIYPAAGTSRGFFQMGSGVSHQVSLALDGSGDLTGFFGGPTCTVPGMATGQTPAVGVWHHVLMTYDAGPGSDNLKIYLNGNEIYTSDCTDSLTPNGEFRIGKRFFISDQIFQGNVDEVGVWNETLGASEVTSIYNQGSPTDLRRNSGSYQSSSGLVGYWRMGDGDTAPTVSDHAGSQSGYHDGTLQGGASFEENGP